MIEPSPNATAQRGVLEVMSMTSLETRAVSIAPLPELFLRRVRSQGIDDLGQPVRRIVAEGGEPCRDVLRRARPGEALILASFTPFTKTGPYKEYGPIFVLANASEEEIQRRALPPAGADTNYLRQQFVVRAYNEAEEISDAALIHASDFDATVERLFASASTAFLHVRFPTYGCFACRIDRA
jgi:hypothetical protein